MTFVNNETQYLTISNEFDNIINMPQQIENIYNNIFYITYR